MRVRLTNSARISVAVASYQVDLRSRVSGKDPLACRRAGQRRGGGVIPGGLEVQGLEKGPPGVLTGGVAEKSVVCGCGRVLGTACGAR